jgi:hypothetical protein
VPEFLSDAWIVALDGALQASADVPALVPLVVEQVVRDVPGRGEVRYRVWFDREGGHAAPTPASHPGGAAPDVRFSTDYGTAVALAQGTDNAQHALASGRLQLGGRIETLAQHSDALTALGDIAAEVRAATTYGDGDRPAP